MSKKYLKKSVSSQDKETKYINKDAARLLQNIENGDDSKVIISFLHLQNSYQCFSEWSKQEMNDFWNFYTKVHEYTWTQIYASARKSNKNGLAYTVIDKKMYPSPEFKTTLSEDITIFELRVNQKARVHGFRNKSVFYICWLDRNHQITK